MDIDENKLSELVIVVCVFLIAGLSLHIWWRPSEAIKNINIFLGGGIVFLLLGIALLIYLFFKYRRQN